MDVHKDIIDSYEVYKRNFRTQDKWVTAEAFTKKLLDYGKNEDLMFNNDWNTLVFKLVQLNEERGNKKTPYTAEKPNFAILISIVKNFVRYSKEYGIDFLQEVLMRFEESAFTGVFGPDGDVNIPKYYNIVYRFLYAYLSSKFTNKDLGNISNTLVYMFLEETVKDLEYKNNKRSLESNVDSQSKYTKKRRGEGIKKRNTKKRNIKKRTTKKRNTKKRTTKKRKTKHKKKPTRNKCRYKQRITKKN